MRIPALVFIGLGATMLAVLEYALSGEFSNYPVTLAAAAFAVGLGHGPLISRVLVVILAVSAAIEVREVWTGTYFFVASDRGVLLTEQLFSGAQGLLRAKGLFQGPLAAAAFAVAVAALYRGEWRVWTLALVAAGLAQGRLAVVLLIAGALIFGLRRHGTTVRPGRRGKRLTLLALAGAAIWYWQFASEATRGNYASAFDTSDPRNRARVWFWQQGFDFVWNRDGLSFLLGNPLGTYDAFGNSAESDILQVFADLGLLGGLLIIAVAAWTCVVGQSRNRWLLILVPIIALTATFAALPTGLVLWTALLRQFEAPVQESASVGGAQRIPTTENSL